MSIGIYDCFGYGPGYDVPFPERYRLIKEAGFDCVMLWWSDRFGRGEGYRKDAELARNAGLLIENMHAPVHEQNFLFSDSDEGESVFRDYLQCIEDCRTYRIPTIVIHLPDDGFPINDTGKDRLNTIIGKAGEYGVSAAFENLRNVRNLSFVMENFTSPHVGMCYDSCHHANYAPGTDLLAGIGPFIPSVEITYDVNCLSVRRPCGKKITLDTFLVGGMRTQFLVDIIVRTLRKEELICLGYEYGVRLSCHTLTPDSEYTLNNA